MTREEFRESMKLAIEDIKNPTSTINIAISEGRFIVHELMQHDPVLAGKVQNIVNEFDALDEYIRSRAENN